MQKKATTHRCHTAATAAAQRALIILATMLPLSAQGHAGGRRAHRPTRLATDLLEKRTDRTYGNAGLVCSSRPSLGWELPAGSMQTAYRVLVATSPDRLMEGKADVWDSGRQEGRQSAGVPYGGAPLTAGTRYWWTVKTWNTSTAADGKEQASRYARAVDFTTAGTLDSCFSHHPLVKVMQKPMRATRPEAHATVYDFGKDAFAQLTLRIRSEQETDSMTVHLGEAARNGRVDRKPRGTVRYARYVIQLRRGTHDYPLNLRPDRRNTAPGANESGVSPILMPEAIGEVFPFRYVEVEGDARVKEAWREAVSEPWDEEEASFHCSDTVLNQVWELCKYSIRATSFAGIYVDGDRERIPYEADALINQLTHYTSDREYSMARRSIAHLIEHPTWPTEWILLTPRMAWNDYLYTGDAGLLERYYRDLGAKTLAPLRDSRGLISTRTGLVTDSVRQSVHFRGPVIRDIVDWPQSGAAGIGKESAGEADGHEMCAVNTVVNAYHYDALHMMSLIAGALGHETDSARFARMASHTAQSMNSLLWNGEKGAYADGERSTHCSQHSSMFPLAFGMVPADRVAQVAAHVQSRGMACSVYGAQFLLDALYEAGQGTFAKELLAGTGLRSWYNMLRMGSTITTEAWDNVYKANLDWNHAWGAAAGNLIARRLMGIEPLRPGWEVTGISPQPGNLDYAHIRQPSPRGSIEVTLSRRKDGKYDLRITIPANSTARVTLPSTGRHMTLGPGKHTIHE